MTYKKWNLTVILLSFIPILLLGIVNYIIDPFNIFHSNFLTKPFQINERYNKIRHLTQHHSEYDSYLMGSSRMGTTDTKTIEKYIKDSHFYNMTVAGCSQYDNLKFLEYFIASGYHIKNIYLQVDATDTYGYMPSSQNYEAQHHPDIQKKNSWRFYLDYLTTLCIKNLWGKIKNNFFTPNDNLMNFDLSDTGRWYVPYLEQRIKENHEQYIASEPTFNKEINRDQQGKFIEENIAALKKIVELTQAHDIHLWVFISPHNHNMMNTLHIESYLEYLKRIAMLTPFWDFSGYNTLSQDNHYYYEMSHYRTELSELVAAKIFNDPTISTPFDFGIFITPQNAYVMLEQRKQAIALHDINYQS